MNPEPFIDGPTPLRRTTFSQRMTAATDHEMQTRLLLEERQWTCEPFGQALLTERIRKLIRTTRSAIRWMPDIIAYKSECVVLVDAKTATRLDTSSWTIEADAYDAGTKFQDAFGHPLIYVWHDFTANLHDDVTFANNEPWGGHTSGSGTPFWLVRKSEQRPLDDVLADVLGVA